MDILLIEPTPTTPKVKFNPNTGVMKLKGRAIPSSDQNFWGDILKWFEEYLLNPQPITTFEVYLDYFNIISSKSILYLLYKLNELKDRGYESIVKWQYLSHDEDMFEVGKDYEYMVNVPFEFIEKQEKIKL